MTALYEGPVKRSAPNSSVCPASGPSRRTHRFYLLKVRRARCETASPASNTPRIASGGAIVVSTFPGRVCAATAARSPRRATSCASSRTPRDIVADRTTSVDFRDRYHWSCQGSITDRRTSGRSILLAREGSCCRASPKRGNHRGDPRDQPDIAGNPLRMYLRPLLNPAGPARHCVSRFGLPVCGLPRYSARSRWAAPRRPRAAKYETLARTWPVLRP